MAFLGMKQKRVMWILAALSVFSAIPASAQPNPGTDTVDFNMTDFENFNNQTSFGGYWATWTDQGSATAIDTIYGNSILTAYGSSGSSLYDSVGNPNREVRPVGHTGDTTTSGLRFGYQLGNRSLSCGAACVYPPYVGFGCGFKPYSGDTLDFTGAAGIAFWAKADSAPLVVGVSVTAIDTADPNAPSYSQNFSLDTTWRLYTIKLVASDSFKLPSYATQKPFLRSRVKGIAFGFSLADNAAHPANAMWIDDLVIQKWKYVEPPVPEDTIPIAIRALAASDRRFGVLKTGDGWRVRLPSIYAGQHGRVEALDAMGRVIAMAPFEAQASEVNLRLAARSATRNTIHFRVIASKSAR
ncbi:MAG: hypothetical protein ABI036_16040 [Fibrobacteria bacterium]